MKFGQHLLDNQFQPWKNEYIQYNYLKQYLKSAQLSATGWTNNDEKYFTDLIDKEFYKVKQFIVFKINQIAEDMKPERANDLIKFVQINTTGFQKIIKKHDKWTDTCLDQQLADIVKQLDEFIVQLSLQQHWTTTRKYWVHPDNLTQVEAILLFNLPMKQDNEMTNTIYFDDSNKFSSYSDLLEQNDLAKVMRARWYGLASQNSNVQIEKKVYHESYFKNKGIYTKEGIQLSYPQVSTFLLTGSYNGPNAEKAKELYDDSRLKRSTIRCFYYRKTYQESPHFRITLDTKITLIKEMGLDWKRNDVGDSYPFDHLRKDEIYYFPFSVLEIKSSSANKELPAWIAKDLISHQLVYEVPFFSKYLHGASHFFSDRIPILPWWLKEMEKDIRKRPSYAVLSTHPSTVQQQCVVIEPPILPDSFNIKDQVHTSSCTVVVDPGQQHSEVQDQKISFYADKFKQLKATYATIHEPIKDQHHVSMTRWLHAKLTNKTHLLLLPEEEEEGEEKKKKKKKRIEPKIHFANERTFINWLQFSGLLMAVSLGLINFGDSVSKGSGAFFIVMAVILAIYAELRFQYRSWQIRFRDEQRFDDMLGPAVLCFVFIIALMINLGLRLNQPLPVDPSPFGYNTTTVDNSSVPVMVQVDKHGHVIPPEEEEA